MNVDEFLIKDGSLFRFCGVNPSFRFIKYKKDDFLVPHYDFPYAFNEYKTTLKSFVIYLNESKGGETRFLKETRINHNFSDMLSGYDRIKVIKKVNPKKGHFIIFDHQTFHDSAKVIEGEKTIIRTDLVYERVI